MLISYINRLVVKIYYNQLLNPLTNRKRHFINVQPLSTSSEAINRLLK